MESSWGLEEHHGRSWASIAASKARRAGSVPQKQRNPGLPRPGQGPAKAPLPTHSRQLMPSPPRRVTAPTGRMACERRVPDRRDAPDTQRRLERRKPWPISFRHVTT